MLKRLLIASAVVVAFVTVPAVSQTASDTPPETAVEPAAPAVSAAMAQAKDNAKRMKRKVAVKSSKDFDYPASEKALGNGGVVVVGGIVNVDGRLEEAVVTKTNASPVLTASGLAMALATEFTPAKDAAGAAIAVPVTLPFTFETETIRSDAATYVEARYDDAVRAAGMNGSVTVEGVLDSEGHLKDARVTVSSRAAELDQAALDAAQATVFRVYRDGDGKLIDTAVKRPYAFSSYRSAGEGGGILRYYCGQFAADQTWWRTAWPEEKSEIYHMMVGVGSMVHMSEFVADTKRLKAYMVDFDTRWDKAIETCRKKPDALFIDVFKPEGEYARRLAQQAG